ncbi:hypothetical protein TWF225_001551 [Orbilia oligospora]|nr:hypothetical protein TWF751_011473 [Orbilia oligospora]KAF3164976.1 hypothetical protein TWF225_001551 [Orbilia oligospora]KAF3164977.1 hypothetical protein TWF225_001551 [Orbilia oligospora]KAF3233419.1 hypothetical protein TWF128_003164 [Orbilia oligospora]KAF3233420.1 hypothetical protein TWF128_003164 [Orbilia oligospora]
MNPLLRPRFGMLSHRFEAFAIYAPLLRWERAAWRVLREYNDVPSMKPERPPETIGEVPVRSGKRTKVSQAGILRKNRRALLIQRDIGNR